MCVQRVEILGSAIPEEIFVSCQTRSKVMQFVGKNSSNSVGRREKKRDNKFEKCIVKWCKTQVCSICSMYSTIYSIHKHSITIADNNDRCRVRRVRERKKYKKYIECVPRLVTSNSNIMDGVTECRM